MNNKIYFTLKQHTSWTLDECRLRSTPANALFTESKIKITLWVLSVLKWIMWILFGSNICLPTEHIIRLNINKFLYRFVYSLITEARKCRQIETMIWETKQFGFHRSRDRTFTESKFK